MNKYLKIGGSVSVRYIDKEIRLLDTSVLDDTAVVTLFSAGDRIFLRKQVAGAKSLYWKKQFPNTLLISEARLGRPKQLKNTIFSYSLPVFSIDGKRALILDNFFCGMVCGGSAYYICEFRDDGKWKVIKKFGELAE
jgi:hypothetical protein